MNFPLSPKEDAKMRAAFEMNLDISSSIMTDTPKSSGPASDAKHFLKMLVSPKFGRKTPSPSVSTKSKSDEVQSPLTTPSPRLQKTLLGSPRLHRAIFGNSKEKRKKLLEQSEPHVLSFAVQDSSVTGNESALVDESLSSFNSSLSNEFSPQQTPGSAVHQRSLQRPPPLISPLQSPTVSSNGNVVVTVSPYDENNSSCPSTPKTPVLKPAMGVSMIGKQRRTPLASDSPFGPPLSPSPSSGGSLRKNSATTQFPYTPTSKESSPAPAPPLIQSISDLEYPPVFEPGTYSLSEKNVEMHSARSSLTSSSLPPVPAPRTKFLSSTSSRLSHSPSMDSTLSSSNLSTIQQHRVHVRLEAGHSIDEFSNA